MSEKFILDGLLIINEVVTWCKRNKKQTFILKIDFEKAYDNVNWNFIVDILEQMGFPQVWRSWINGILKSARSSVLVNGSPTFEFQFGKEMRQGDPISPFLSLIVMEAFSCMLSKAQEEGLIKGIQTPNGSPTLSHFLFADDAIIIVEWSDSCIENLVRILRCFYI